MVPFFCSNRRRSSRRTDWSSLQLEPRILPSAIQVRMTQDANGAVDLRITGTADSDTVQISTTSNGLIQVDLSVNGVQQGQPLIIQKLSDVSADLGAGFDSFMIMDGVVMDDLYVKDGATTQEGGFHLIQSFGNSVRLGNVRFDISHATVPVHLQSNTSLTLRSLTFNYMKTVATSIYIGTNGEGSSFVVENRFSVKSSSPASFDRVEVVNGGNRDNRMEFRGGINLALGHGSTFTASTGLNGRTDISGNVVFATTSGVGSFSSTGRMTITGNLKTHVDRVSVIGPVTIRGTAEVSAFSGPAYVTLMGSSSERMLIGKNLRIDTSNSNDTINVENALVVGDIDINTGRTLTGTPPAGTPSKDSVTVAHTEVLGKTRVVSRGAATISLAAKDALLPRTRFHGTVSVRLGSGDVNVNSVVNPAAAVSFGGKQEYTGTASRILVRYSPGVIFQTALRKLINAVLG